MAIDPAANIAVLSTCRYRAESLAFALTQRLGLQAGPAPDHSMEALTDFGTILIDLDWGVDNALQLTHAVTTLRPEVKVVFLGLVESKESVLRLAGVGAAGYVSSTASLEELCSVVQAVQKGEFACPPHITYALFSHLARLARSSFTRQIEAIVLTARERQIMELLSRSLSNKEIAEQLCLSGHTVKNHVHRILKKLGISNRGFAARSYSHSFAIEARNARIPERELDRDCRRRRPFGWSVFEPVG